MKLHLHADSGVTLIENTFIDQYMPGANGEYVKLYLYLLRCAGTGTEISISSVADFFDHTEKDVRRALAYWVKLDLLRVRYDEDGLISDIEFVTHDTPEEDRGRTREVTARIVPIQHPSATQEKPARKAAADSEAAAASSAQEPAPEVPSKRSLSPTRRRQLAQQEEMRQLFYVAEKYLERPLTTTEMGSIMYFYDCLHFSGDLIEYLLEYCATKGNPGVRYMEKVAQGWYRDGITTVEAASESSGQYNRDYYAILRAFGISGHNPVAGEIEYMDRWLGAYGMPLDLIEEACSRTILQAHQPSFDYADKILSSWHDAGVRSREDIDRLDRQHESSRSQARASRKTASPAAGSASATRFGNFPQREYDWSALERQLIQAQKAAGSEDH